MTNAAVRWVRPLLVGAACMLGACSGSSNTDGQVMADMAAAAQDFATGPDLATSTPADLAGSTADLTGGPGDLAIAPDLASASVNGCTAATAEDHTADAAVTITFSGTSYTPACVKVSVGTKITFQGSFSFHPLAGGGSPPSVDATSPIAVTNSGTTATFTLPAQGTFGFFCQVHWAVGMKGAIFVE